MEEIKTNIPKEKKTCHIESVTVDEFVKDAPPRRWPGKCEVWNQGLSVRLRKDEFPATGSGEGSHPVQQRANWKSLLR